MATSATIWPGSHPIMRSSTHALAAGQVLGAIRRHCTTGHIQVIRGQKHDDQISPSFALLLAKAAGQQCRAAAAETHPHEPRCNAEEAVVKKNSKKAVFLENPWKKISEMVREACCACAPSTRTVSLLCRGSSHTNFPLTSPRPPPSSLPLPATGHFIFNAYMPLGAHWIFR